MDVIKFSCRFQMLLIFSILFLLHLTSSQLESKPVEVSATFPGAAIYGSFVELTCSWFLEPKYILTHLIITASESPMNITFSNGFTNGISHLFIDKQPDNRTYFRGQSDKMIMRMDNIQCSDQQVYTCTCVYVDKTTSDLLNQYISDSARLSIQVPPGSVNITIAGPDSNIIAGYQQVSPGETFNVVCSGTVGYYGEPIIEWAMFRNFHLETIPTKDSRIKDMEFVEILPEDPSCSQRVQQTFTVKTSPEDSFIVISCFLHYNDTPVATDSFYCWKSSTDICMRSVQVMIVQSEPSDNHPDLSEQKAFSKNAEFGGDSSPAVIIVSIGLYTIFVGFIVGVALSYIYHTNTERNKSDNNIQKQDI